MLTGKFWPAPALKNHEKYREFASTDFAPMEKYTEGMHTCLKGTS